ncbi:hypothetical protein KQI82_10975 [Oscillibacter sp. MSJ-2]|uniref:DUF2007 domain-containing protein n=1 Tax=Dysosmobacter acutus TaxID=2841504 RepID=A0ABS6FDH5_9FIRM|nr:hypothetical protein [Dysosmobacter acutus]MBU5627430.1 hypothetical protein [Dysosmobacter acutus]
MITMFNRRELTVVWGMEKLNALRAALSEAGIESAVKAPGLAADALNHAQVGGLETRTPQRREYILYVAKEDYQRAAALIRGRA